MAFQIINYFEINKLFIEAQPGFLGETWHGFKLSKVFDCVSHSLSTEKLKSYNFDAHGLQLMELYLTKIGKFLEWKIFCGGN